MTQEEKTIEKVNKKVVALMKSPEWKESLKKTDKKIEKAIEKMKKEAQVDPRLLDEPATL
ncbi:MAG: hypothetical protein V3V99_10045 [candidate division Zixibacteria bacterium]